MTEPESKSGKSTEGHFPKVPAVDPQTMLRAAAATGKDTPKAKSLEDSKTLILSSAGAKIEVPEPESEELEGSKTFVQSTAAVVGNSSEKAAGLAFQQISGIRLVKELGRGGMGVVYRGKQEFLDREVAVKMLLEQRKNPDFAARFKREAKILAGLQHPHIVTCYQADVTPDGTCFLVMEFVNGPNLREHLFKQGPLSVTDALRVCRDLAAALACAHEKKIIHRDVKSENVLLAPDPNSAASCKFPYNVKLTDLGLARPETHDAGTTGLHLTMQASIVGTPQNMSPEQFDDPQGVDHRTDIYGLGCVLYDTLITKPPFKERSLSGLLLAKRQAVRGPDPRAARPDVDPAAAKLVMSMLAAAREDRPQTYADLIATCNGLIARLAAAEAKKQCKPSRAPLFAALASIGLLGGVGAWYALRDKPATATPPETAKPTPATPEKTPEVAKVEPSKVPVAVLEPTLLIEGSSEVTENERIKLRAIINNQEGGDPQFTWTKLSGPELAFEPKTATLEFTAPESAANYQLEFKLDVKSGTKDLSETRRIQVKATNAKPVVSLSAPAPALEGKQVELVATVHDVDSESALQYQWRQVAPSAPRVHFADEHLRSTSFIAPLCVSDDYELTLELTTSDRGEFVSEQVKVSVAAVPERKALTPKELRKWMAPIVDGSNRLDGWEQGKTGLTLAQTPEGFSADCAEGTGWITRALPLGSYVLNLELQPTRKTGSGCGLMLSYDESSAWVLCVLPRKGGLFELDSYTALRLPDGSWSEPKQEERSQLLIFPAEQDMIELELTWDGKSLKLRSCDPSAEAESKKWTAADAPFQLSSAPTSAALFVKGGKMSVKDVGIRGL